MNTLLCRHAEAAFWMARYVERAESLARALDVHDTFNRSSQGDANWKALLAIYDDTDRFLAERGKVTARGVVMFYLFDEANLGSVRCSLRAARENARTLRPRMSSEIWEQLNTFHNEFQKIDPEALQPPFLYALCRELKEQVQRHTGIVEGTMFRDEAWHFYQIGRQLERAAQTAHYLDARYKDLAGARDGTASPAELSQWTALLRAQAGLHGYRLSRQNRVSPRGVADFLLFDPCFPRSIRGSLRKLKTVYEALHDGFGLDKNRPSRTSLERLALRFRELTIDDVLRGDIHLYLDTTQRELYRLADQLASEYFTG